MTLLSAGEKQCDYVCIVQGNKGPCRLIAEGELDHTPDRVIIIQEPLTEFRD